MTKFLLEVDLPAQEYCDGCDCLYYDGYYNCSALSRQLEGHCGHNKTIRPPNCPLKLIEDKRCDNCKHSPSLTFPFPCNTCVRYIEYSDNWEPKEQESE